MPEIRLENISKMFGDTVGANGLTLDIADGEYLCILGPTGAGKTTCMRIICGLTSPDEGRIYFDGKDVTDMPVDEREATMLTQSYSLFPRVNVEDNVLFGPRLKGWDEESCQQLVRNMLGMTHMEGRGSRLPNELSGGQQQRVALARALASGSKVLLLDEPLRALDARLRLELRKELKSLAKSMGLTSIHVTHDQDEALEMADRIAVIRDGRFVQIGAPQEVFENPATPFVANFVGRSNIFEGTLVYAGNGTSRISAGEGITVLARDPGYEPGTKVLVAVKIGNTKISHVKAEKPPEPEAKRIEPIQKIPKPKPVLDFSFRGRIDRILYEGATITVEIDVPRLGLISSKLPNRKYDDYDVGEEVEVTWSPSKASVFPYPENGIKDELRLD